MFHYFGESNIFITSVSNLIELIKLITIESCKIELTEQIVFSTQTKLKDILLQNHIGKTFSIKTQIVWTSLIQTNFQKDKCFKVLHSLFLSTTRVRLLVLLDFQHKKAEFYDLNLTSSNFYLFNL